MKGVVSVQHSFRFACFKTLPLSRAFPIEVENAKAGSITYKSVLSRAANRKSQSNFKFPTRRKTFKGGTGKKKKITSVHGKCQASVLESAFLSSRSLSSQHFLHANALFDVRQAEGGAILDQKPRRQATGGSGVNQRSQVGKKQK